MTCLDSGQRLLAYLHPQFEDEDDRKKTFEYWPCLPQTEEQLVEAGFYFTGQVSTEGPVHTVNPGKPHLDMLSISAALECNYSIEQIREAVLRFFMLSRGQYPNTAILLGLLQATDRNFNMLQQQRQRTHIKDTELQKEKETSRTAECRLVREQQTHRALVEGQAAVIQIHRQQLENKQQIEKNQKEMIRRLAGELQKVG
ncbi:uncharacterized protein LOC121378196 isoform X1 [Gigantopelta aegis]|uniref:uncharacterized protein LOC121378196 isoform X1 n=1 Tax=Gigantopelta aegis TaxID=1735272 RepID=UPI001B889697|nr:uncharacterized protein LOC121378196 isoform X1 [Gigantopelta aegis]